MGGRRRLGQNAAHVVVNAGRQHPEHSMQQQMLRLVQATHQSMHGGLITRLRKVALLGSSVTKRYTPTSSCSTIQWTTTAKSISAEGASPAGTVDNHSAYWLHSSA